MSDKAPPQSTKATIARVARVATMMQFMCVIGSLVFAAELFMQWDTHFIFAAGDALRTDNSVTIVQQGWSTLLAKTPYAAAVVIAFRFAFQTFGYFKRGDILTEQSAISLNRMSWAVLLATLFHTMTGPLTNLIQANNDLNIVISDIHLIIVFLCMILLAISWVLREASKQIEDVKLIF